MNENEDQHPRSSVMTDDDISDMVSTIVTDCGNFALYRPRQHIDSATVYHHMAMYCFSHNKTFDNPQQFRAVHNDILNAVNNTLSNQWALVSVSDLKRIISTLPDNMKVFVEPSSPDLSTVELVDEYASEYPSMFHGKVDIVTIHANPAFGVRVAKDLAGEQCLFIYTSY